MFHRFVAFWPSIPGSQAFGRFPWPAGLAGGRAYSAGRRGGRVGDTVRGLQLQEAYGDYLKVIML